MLAPVITAIACVVTLTLLTLLVIYVRSNTVFRDPQVSHLLKPVNCRSCNGWGEQMLTDDGWAVIPVHMRAAGKTVNLGDAPSPIANARTCPGCHGAGHTWRIPAN